MDAVPLVNSPCLLMLTQTSLREKDALRNGFKEQEISQGREHSWERHICHLNNVYCKQRIRRRNMGKRSLQLLSKSKSLPLSIVQEQ